MDLSKLKEPFPAEDIEWRLQSCGSNSRGIYAICLAYVTNRAICNRLDEVVGPENWKNEFIKGPDGGVLCGLSIKVDGEFITKWDGAENTDIEGVKGGLSGAMKRSASTGWGIGRYLYNLEENFATVLPEDAKEKAYFGKTKDGKKFKWLPPELPSWALPGGEGKPPRNSKPTSKQSSKTEEKKEEPKLSKEEIKKRCEDIKGQLITYEDIVPKESWKDIDAAVKVATEESLSYLKQMLNWASSKSKKAS